MSSLAPPGSSTYNSATMFVGDGTWDSQRNTFLLPNLQGLNFNTMRYNGMGNRFAEVPQYFTLVQAHGILAAITFLLFVPSAIMVLRFYGRDPFVALRIHIWLQILTIMLTTVIFVLGYFAVGPERSLTNPHHGIGVAIFLLVIVQFVGGWWVHSRERRKRLTFLPLKVVIHQWFGRSIALLGIIQIALGLTLYGSPLYLFVLYTLATFTLLVIYFILSYRREKYRAREYNSDYSYASGSGSIDRREPGRLGNLAQDAAAGLGLAALANRFRNRRQDPDRPEVAGPRRHSGSYVEEEKYSQYGRDPGKEGGWTRKLLGAGAIAGLTYWGAKLLGRRRAAADDDSRGSETSIDSVERIERVEEGQPIPENRHPLNDPLNQTPERPPLGHRRSDSALSYESYLSGSPSRRPGHKIRDAVVGLGAFGIARNLFKNRRERKEQRRIDELRRQEIEEERIARQNSQRHKFTGDGFPRHGNRRDSVTTSATGITDDRIRRGQGVPPPIPGTAVPIGSGATAGHPVASGALTGSPLPMPPTIHEQGATHDSSGSEIYNSTGSRRHKRQHVGRDTAAAALAGGAAGLIAGETLAERRSRDRRHHSASAGDGSVTSPDRPVSVKVKMHSDGRHVTLRRLPEEEAAAERAARRNGRRRRAGSVSSLSGTEPSGGERWRRTEDRERQEAEFQQATERERLQASQAQLNQGKLAVPLPPPPPIPQSHSEIMRPGTGSIGSPGTEASTEYANNRRRRRAERAQAKLTKEGRVAAGEFN